MKKLNYQWIYPEEKADTVVLTVTAEFPGTLQMTVPLEKQTSKPWPAVRPPPVLLTGIQELRIRVSGGRLIYEVWQHDPVQS